MHILKWLVSIALVLPGALCAEIELRGVMAVSGAHLVCVGDSGASQAAKWLRPGEAFGAYVYHAFDVKRDTARLKKGERMIELTLKKPDHSKDSRPPKEMSDGELISLGLHRLASAETLGSVARLYGVKPADIAVWNQIVDPARLKAGMILSVSGPLVMPTEH